MLHFNKFKFNKIFLFLYYDTTPIFSRLPNLLCHCDDTNIAKLRKDDDVDDIYIDNMIKCVFVCVSCKMITSHFQAELGLAGRRPALQ